jgi:hypothetical protein
LDKEDAISLTDKAALEEATAALTVDVYAVTIRPIFSGVGGTQGCGDPHNHEEP